MLELLLLEPPELALLLALALTLPAWAPPEELPPSELLLQAENKISAQPTTVAFCEEIPRRLVMAPSRESDELEAGPHQK